MYSSVSIHSLFEGDQHFPPIHREYEGVLHHTFEEMMLKLGTLKMMAKLRMVYVHRYLHGKLELVEITKENYGSLNEYELLEVLFIVSGGMTDVLRKLSDIVDDINHKRGDKA
jgi:hypothetical protein